MQLEGQAGRAERRGPAGCCSSSSCRQLLNLGQGGQFAAVAAARPVVAAVRPQMRHLGPRAGGCGSLLLLPLLLLVAGHCSLDVLHHGALLRWRGRLRGPRQG